MLDGPMALRDYNIFMRREVDKGDQLITLYNGGRQTKKSGRGFSGTMLNHSFSTHTFYTTARNLGNNPISHLNPNWLNSSLQVGRID